jgi:hypothetical protein
MYGLLSESDAVSIVQLLKQLLPINLFSLEGTRALTMGRFYRFFITWLAWVSAVTYGCILIPIKITASRATHVSDAHAVFALINQRMAALYASAYMSGKPVVLEDALEALRHDSPNMISAVTTPLRLSGMNAQSHCLQPQFTCYRFLMSRKHNHSGVLAYDHKARYVIYDADGGIQSRRVRLFRVLNVMTLFPLVDGRPFCFTVDAQKTHLLPLKQRAGQPAFNQLGYEHRLYGFISLFERPEQQKTDLEPLIQFSR